MEDEPPQTPLQQLARWLAPRDYRLTRWLVLRLLGVVYTFAFLGLLFQGLPLLGSHGLTPIGAYLDRLHDAGVGFWQLPTLFHASASDAMIRALAVIGLVLSVACVAGYANLPSLLILWAIYGSFERVGQMWFSFGWEIQLLETGLLCAFLAHPWDPRPLAARAPPATAVVLLRWLAIRIMLGAGLIKLRGDHCWTELTCLDSHFETQPIPSPLSAGFHHMPHWVHAAGVVANHVVEVVLPWFAFGPRRLRLVAATGMIGFQLVLIASGNLAFLNWLTLVPCLALLDDDALLRLSPRRAAAWLRARLTSEHARLPHRVACYVLAALVFVKSFDVIANLASHDQQMNASYDRLELVNTYGAFGSVGRERHELVIEGTLDADPDHATWSAYELPCKPGALDRRPCLLGPYHMRLDWLIWFAAMAPKPHDAWVLHLVWKLLDGDRGVRELIATDPFDGVAPRWVRIRRFAYHLQSYGDDTWWTRDHEQLWLPPQSLESADLKAVLADYGWPSPTQR
nr:lipase maturation factor family protein [Kofleriaceae bacterium]